MTWNHRVVRRKYPKAAMPEDRVMFQIHEAYYHKNGTCYAITTEPARLMEQDVGQLRETLKRIARALNKPTLDYRTRKEIK